jgi:small subunit ribosomal protein S6e
MAEFKLVINDPKTGRSYSKAITTDVFKGKKIKDKIKGDEIGLTGYELEITGGSDKDGFPMRYDLEIPGRKKILVSKGPCVKIRRKGLRKRKTVRGNLISLNISQINLKIIKEGSKKPNEIFKVEEPKDKLKKEEKTAEIKEKVKEEKGREGQEEK